MGTTIIQLPTATEAEQPPAAETAAAELQTLTQIAENLGALRELYSSQQITLSEVHQQIEAMQSQLSSLQSEQARQAAQILTLETQQLEEVIEELETAEEESASEELVVIAESPEGETEPRAVNPTANSTENPLQRFLFGKSRRAK
jgi:DNA-directed RNA polymerase subunit F